MKKLYALTIILTTLCSGVYAAEKGEEEGGEPSPRKRVERSSGASRLGSRVARSHRGADSVAGASDFTGFTGLTAAVGGITNEELRLAIPELASLRNAWVTVAMRLGVPLDEHGYDDLDPSKVKRKPSSKKFIKATKEAAKIKVLRIRDLESVNRELQERLASTEARAMRFESECKRVNADITAEVVRRFRSEKSEMETKLHDMSRELAAARARATKSEQAAARAKAAVMEIRSPGLRSPAGRARVSGTPGSARRGAARAQSPTKERLRTLLEEEKERNEELSARLAELEARAAGSSVFSPSRHEGVSRGMVEALRRSASPMVSPSSRSGRVSASPSERAMEATALAAEDRRLSDGSGRVLLPAAGRENRVGASSARRLKARKPRRDASGITSRRTPGKASAAETAKAMAAALEEEGKTS